MIENPGWKPTISQMREQLGEQVLGDNADVGLDMVVEDETRRESGLVLATPPQAPCPRRGIRGGHCGVFEERSMSGWKTAKG